MAARIAGTGSCVPKQTVSNDFLSGIVDTSDEWISSRTGIRRRRIAKEETTVSMAAEAAGKALLSAGMEPQELDLIIVATLTPDRFMPSTACEVQNAIGAVNAAAFDLGAACSGFLFALNTVCAYMNSGLSKNALIIGAETLSRLIDWEDRSTCVLFGDGAGAAVLKNDGEGVLSFIQKSDGSKGDVLSCFNRGIRNPLNSSPQELKDYISMDGQEVFRFAVKRVPECIEELLLKTNTAKEDIRYYILHQANERILRSAAKRLHEPEDKFPMNLEEYGNTSAASIPILLDEMNRGGRIKRGDLLVISGFGAGLTWGAALVKW